MADVLRNKGNIILVAQTRNGADTNGVPSTEEINKQFAPKSLQETFDSLATEDSGRTDSGKMWIDWVLKRTRKLEIELPPYLVSDTRYNWILDKVLGRTLYVIYFDIVTNAEKTINVYCSNGSGDWYSGVVHNGLLQGVSFNLIEIEGEH